jgi:hypothetical protein
LDLLRASDVAPPVVGYELAAGVKVVAEAELAWAKRQIGVVSPEYVPAFSENGWQVVDIASAKTTPSNLLDKLKSE